MNKSNHVVSIEHGGHATATGHWDNAVALAPYGHAVASGNFGLAVSAGHHGSALASGVYGCAIAARCHSVASTTGAAGHAVATDTRGKAVATGEHAHAVSVGERGHASTAGRSIAVSIGVKGSARAEEGGAIVLAAYNDEGDVIAVFAAMVGEHGIQPGVSYRLAPDGTVHPADEDAEDEEMDCGA